MFEMLPDANLLFYTNLSGEVFYIISHRMKSQGVKIELQQRVYNDLAICICHPVVVQNLLKGALRLLEMSMTDIRTLMDRIVHSSIMTVNAFSMEKLFELTLIATRYQYTVCQHPNDILLIALNHLDGIRNSITDSTGIQLCESLHKIFIERLRGESSMKMQEYRFAVLTYLADVKLKMTNLIKLGFQKTTGEFVKDFPDKNCRKEFKNPGTIELFHGKLDRSDSSDTSDSNNEVTDENFNVDDEEIEDDLIERPPPWMVNEFGGESHHEIEDGCHFDNISLQIHDHELQEDEEFLEIEFVESSFQEVLESSNSNPSLNTAFIVKFSRKRSIDHNEEEETSSIEPFVYSFDLNGSRGITLGKSIYEIPGNSDEIQDDVTASTTVEDSTKAKTSESTTDQISQLKETDLNSVAIKAVHGLELCSVMLGLGNKSDSELQYKSPLSNFRFNSPSAAAITTDGGESSQSHEPYNIPFESCSNYSQSSSGSRTIKEDNKTSGLTGINIIKFDARTDRSQNKAALSKISRELDLGSEDFDVEQKVGNKGNVFDFLQGEDE